MKIIKRTCNGGCNRPLPLDAFGTYRSRGKTLTRRQCRECFNKKYSPKSKVYMNRYYHENKNGFADKVRKRTADSHAANPQAHYQRNLQYMRRHPQKAACAAAVRDAIMNGALKKLPCSVCGGLVAEAHHDDYSKPLDVMWLCKKHHGERHRQINRGEIQPANLT